LRSETDKKEIIVHIHNPPGGLKKNRRFAKVSAQYFGKAAFIDPNVIHGRIPDLAESR
jgi:hypothetical protein